MGINTDLFDLTGQVALLTGASKGMGKSMAMALAEHGSKVVVSSRKLDQCEETAKEINDACGEERAIAIACNIGCLLYTSPSPRDPKTSRMPSSA